MAGLLFTNIFKITLNKGELAASNPFSCKASRKVEAILERMQQVKPEDRISIACALKEFEELGKEQFFDN